MQGILVDFQSLSALSFEKLEDFIMVKRSILALTVVLFSITGYPFGVPQDVISEESIRKVFPTQEYRITKLSRDGNRQCAVVETAEGKMAVFYGSISNKGKASPLKLHDPNNKSKGRMGPVLDVYSEYDQYLVDYILGTFLCS